MNTQSHTSSPCFSHNRQLSGDPTNTRDIREGFIREIRRRFREIRGVIRRTVGYDTDAFNLSQNQIDEGGPYDFPTDQQKIQAFMRDVKQWINDNLLEPVGFGPTRDGQHWTGQYIRGAYERGWQNSEGRLRNVGVSISESSVESVFDVPIAVDQLRKLYTRTFENLKGITDDMAGVIREELTLGLADGLNPRDIADNITSELDTMQKTRAETLARTEVINSYSTATLDRYERAGVQTVGHGEWSTANDSRVCPICEALEGVVLTLSEMRNGSFRLPGINFEIPLRPPAHPNGRCAIMPVLGLDPADLDPLDDRLPDQPAR